MTAADKTQLDRQLHEIAAEIEGLMLSGKVVGIAAVVIEEDGTAHTRVRYIPGGRLGLVAGTVLLQTDLVQMIRATPHG